MSARHCPVCGGPMRTSRRVLLVHGSKLRGANACLGCAATALRIVPAAPVTKCSSCDRPAVRCASHASRDVNRDRASVLADVTRRLRAIHRTIIDAPEKHLEEYQRGRRDALEAALDLLEGGRS